MSSLATAGTPDLDSPSPAPSLADRAECLYVPFLVGFLPAAVTWSHLQLALAGRWDAGYLPGLAGSYLIPGYLLFWVWVVARGEERRQLYPEGFQSK